MAEPNRASMSGLFVCVRTFVVGSSFVLSQSLGAQSVTPTAASAPARAPTPCADAPERHRFDFWIGEWTVTGPTGSGPPE